MLQLKRYLNGVLSRRPGLALGLWGEAGVGKSFTARALLQETPCQSLSLHACLSDSALLLSLPRPPKRPQWTEALRERILGGQSIASQALLETLTATLAALAPFVLHLEDLHEASPQRLELIRQLARMLPRLRGVGLLVTSRVSPPEPFRAYRIEPLAREQSDRLLEGQAEARLPGEGLSWVFSRTQGNPLFALEFWRYLTRRGFFWLDGQHWHWRTPPDDFVPVSVEALISHLLSELDGESRTALEVRAMFPAETRLSASLWAKVASLDPGLLLSVREPLEAKRILHDSGFAHPLFQEVVRREIPAQCKQSYARRALEGLQEEPETAALFVEDARLEADQQQGYYRRAAEAAQSLGRVAQAGHWLARAADNAQGLERGLLAHQAGRHLSMVEPPEAVRWLEVALAEDPRNTQAAILLATNYARMGLLGEMNRVLQGLPQDASTQQHWLKAMLMIRSGQRDQRGVVALWEQHPELHAHPDPDTAYRVGFAYMELGDPGKAQGLAASALQAPDLTPLHKLKLLSVCGLAHRLSGDLETARSFLDEAVNHARACGPANLASSLNNRQIVLSMLGLYAEAEADLRQAIELYRSTGISLNYASSLSSLGGLLGAMGRYEEAEAKLLEAHETLSRLDNSGFLCSAECNLCELYLAWRPPHGLRLAQKYAGLALDHAQSLEPRHLASALQAASALANELSQHQRALELAQQCLRLDQVNAGLKTQALLGQAAALEGLGRKLEAIHTLQQAHSMAIDQADAQRIALELARLQNHPKAAQEALEWFRQRGLLGVVEAALWKWPELNAAAQAAPAEDLPELSITVLGTPRLQRNGEPISYRGKRRLELLCYMLEARIAGKQEVSVLELMDAFYPQMPESQAKSTLRQQMYLIRTVLGKESIQSTPSGYALGALASDAEAFLQTGEASLWRGPYLQGLAEGWNAGVRDALSLALRARLASLLEADAQEAARLGRILLEMEPYDGEALRLTLAALRASGQLRSSDQLYQQQRTHWLEVGEELPERLEEFISG